jgi:hypothetical protein
MFLVNHAACFAAGLVLFRAVDSKQPDFDDVAGGFDNDRAAVNDPGYTSIVRVGGEGEQRAGEEKKGGGKAAHCRYVYISSADRKGIDLIAHLSWRDRFNTDLVFRFGARCFTERLPTLRLERGWSQQKLSEKAYMRWSAKSLLQAES